MTIQFKPCPQRLWIQSVCTNLKERLTFVTNISIGRTVTMIVGLMFTLIPYGTDKDNIIKQFQLGRRVLGPNNCCIQELRDLAGINLVKLYFDNNDVNSITIPCIVDSLQKADLVQGLLHVHYEDVQKTLTTFLSRQMLPYNGLRLRWYASNSPLDPGESIKYKIYK